MPETPMTERDFAGKVEWEGGIVDALEYGLKSEAGAMDAREKGDGGNG